MLHLHHKRREGWELNDVAGERVEEADGGILVSLEDQEALDGVKNTMIREQREPDADKDPRVEVEESNVFTEIFMAGVKAMALGEHHPEARVKARIGHASAARRYSGRPPIGTDGTEANIVRQVANQQAPPHKTNHIFSQRCPWESGGRRQGR
jgi:hypothetical protein